jgi:hypothetical protein
LLGLLPSNGNTNINGKQITSFGDSEGKTALNASVRSTEYSKDSAIADAKGAANYAITQTLQQSVPGITSSDKAAGGYNNTTTGMLENDANAKAAAAGQGVLLQNIRSYADARATTIGANVAATNVLSDKTTNTTGANTQASKGAFGDMLNPVSGAGTVICTQLTRDGWLSKRVWMADNYYVYYTFNADTINGYRYWAVPFVRLMRRNKVAYAVGKFLGMRWSLYCASCYSKHGKWNIVGYLLVKCIAPVCELIGRIVPPPEYKSLWVSSN